MVLATRGLGLGALVLSVGLAAGIGALVQGLKQGDGWYQSPGLFPLVAMALAAVAAIATLTRSWREGAAGDGGGATGTQGTNAMTAARGTDDAHDANDVVDDAADEFDAAHSRPALALAAMGLLALYPLSVLVAGLVPGTVMFATGTAVVAGLPPRRALLVGAVLAAVMYGVFVLGFRVWFPESWLMSLLKGRV